jgi:hypothetical protein
VTSLYPQKLALKFRRQVAVAQSIYFACGLRATELVSYGAGVEPSPRILRPLNGLLYKPWMIDSDDCAAISGMNGWQGKLKYWELTRPSAALSVTDPT